MFRFNNSGNQIDARLPGRFWQQFANAHLWDSYCSWMFFFTKPKEN